jgi:cell division protein ZapA (FtsZ GTPase activity inhibitor)
MARNRIEISLLRQSFSVLCDESPEYMHELEASVNERIGAVKRQYPTMNITRCTLLAMLNLEDELCKLKDEYKALEEKAALLRGLNRPAPSQNYGVSDQRAAEIREQIEKRMRAEKEPSGV